MCQKRSFKGIATSEIYLPMLLKLWIHSVMVKIKDQKIIEGLRLFFVLAITVCERFKNNLLEVNSYREAAAHNLSQKSRKITRKHPKWSNF